jgi:hypothetical protein
MEMVDEADEGTMLHEVCEKQLLVPAADRDLRGLGSEQREAVERALAYVTALVSAKAGVKVETEVRLDFYDLTWGTADVVICGGTEADVVDYKFGRTAVSPVAAGLNLQLATYCGALMTMRPELEIVRGHVVQPRLGVPNWETFDRSLVDKVRARIELVYGKAAHPFSPATPGEHCSLCRYSSECPALKPTLIRVSEAFSMPVPEVLRGEVPATPEDRYRIHALFSVLERMADQWKAANRAFVIDEGGEIPGLVVRERSSGPRVPSEHVASAMRKLRDEGYASEDQLLNCLKISIPDLAKQMTEVRGGTEKEERARILEILEGLVIESTTKFLAKAPKERGKKNE